MTCTSCEKPSRSRGLCEAHYRQVLRAEKPKTPERVHQQRLAAAAKGRAVQAERWRERTCARLDDLEELLAWGEWPPRAVARLDWSIGAAIRAAERYGRPSIPAVLYRFEKEEQ